VKLKSLVGVVCTATRNLVTPEVRLIRDTAARKRTDGLVSSEMTAALRLPHQICIRTGGGGLAPILVLVVIVLCAVKVNVSVVLQVDERQAKESLE
jgi:hypothetical protein